jgi:hypothetical protein
MNVSREARRRCDPGKDSKRTRLKKEEEDVHEDVNRRCACREGRENELAWRMRYREESNHEQETEGKKSSPQAGTRSGYSTKTDRPTPLMLTSKAYRQMSRVTMELAISEPCENDKEDKEKTGFTIPLIARAQMEEWSGERGGRTQMTEDAQKVRLKV